LNVRGVNGVRETEIHTAEPLLAVSSAVEVEVEMVVEKLKRKDTKHKVLIKAQQN